MSDLIKRIDAHHYAEFDASLFKLLEDCKAEIQRLLLANETLTALNAEYAERIGA